MWTKVPSCEEHRDAVKDGIDKSKITKMDAIRNAYRRDLKISDFVDLRSAMCRALMEPYIPCRHAGEEMFAFIDKLSKVDQRDMDNFMRILRNRCVIP
jgi:hypothetical protein